MIVGEEPDVADKQAKTGILHNSLKAVYPFLMWIP